MVSVSDSLDQLEDDLIIKCAECEGNVLHAKVLNNSV